MNRPRAAACNATMACGRLAGTAMPADPSQGLKKGKEKWLEGAFSRPRGGVRNYFSTILDYSASMGTRPDNSKKTAVRAPQRRQTLLAAWLDVLDQFDGPGRQRPETPARSTIPTSRQPRSARTRRRLATYSQEGHVAAVTARLRRTAPL
jgi:hypothetical protein